MLRALLVFVQSMVNVVNYTSYFYLCLYLKDIVHTYNKMHDCILHVPIKKKKNEEEMITLIHSVS